MCNIVMQIHVLIKYSLFVDNFILYCKFIHTLRLQVVWLGDPLTKSTWESAADLPGALVKEYEDGLSREIQGDAYTSGGQTVCTLSSTLKPTQPQAKKACMHHSSKESSNSGYVCSRIWCSRPHMQMCALTNV